MKHPLRPTGRYLAATSEPRGGSAGAPSGRIPGAFGTPRRVLAALAIVLLLSAAASPFAEAQQTGAPSDNAAAGAPALAPADQPSVSPADNAASPPAAGPENAPGPAIPPAGPAGDNAASPPAAGKWRAGAAA